ncbi:MATE family efflux transporter [soil metagenome]
MKVESTYSDIWRISWPIMLSSLANTVINFTDVAFVSRVGEKQLAASALGGVFYFILVMIGIAVGIGSQILIARKAGEDNHNAIGKVFDHSILIMLSMGVVMLLLLYGLMPGLMHLIVNDRQVADYCIEYLNARGWGLFFMLILIALRSFYTGIAMTRIITYTTVVMMVLNVILNYFLTLGHGGIPAMGIFGTGLASAISETVAAIYAIAYTILRPSLKVFGLFRFKQMKKAIASEIISLSAPIVLQHFLSMGAWFIFFVLIEKLGSRSLAVSNVVRSIYMVLMTPIWGFSQSCNSMVSNLIGQKKENELMSFVGKIVSLSFITGVVATIFWVIFPDFLFGLTTPDPTLTADAMGSFYVICFATIIFSVAMILLSAVSGTGNTRIAMLIEVFNIAVYLIYIFLGTMYFHTSVEIVWGAEIIYWFLMGALSLWYLKSNRWKNMPELLPVN